MAHELLDPQLERLPWSQVEELSFERLRETVARACDLSPYYRSTFGEAGISAADLHGPEDLARLPFFDKAAERDAQRRLPPFGDHLCVGAEAVVRVHASSGTTGTPTFFALTASDVAVWDDIGRRAFFTAGMRRTDVYGMLGNLSMFVGGVPSLTAASALGATSVPIGVYGGSDRALDLMVQLGVTVIGCTPSFALHLGERAVAMGADKHVRLVLVGGEPGGQIAGIRQQISEVWGAKVRDVLGLGEVANSLWAESDDEDGLHFCGQLAVYLELIEPETGRRLDLVDGATGELVYTTIAREATPVIRFRSHDVVRIAMAPTASGRTVPRIFPLGRSDDMLIVRGVNVFPTAVREVVSEFHPETNGHIRIFLDRPGPAAPAPLEIHVEAKEAASDLARRIQERVRGKLGFAAAVTVVGDGALPRSQVKTNFVVVRGD